MINGAHVVLASKNPDADHAFFRDVLKLSSIDLDGSYVIIRLPESEASIHPTDGEVPHHELYFLCDDINAFTADMKGRGVECGEIRDQGWGILVTITLPSGSPLQVYQARYKRPSESD
ncbi:MAG: extradiol dioxygenase [Acidobacteria bacterium]|nr:MAG: extradiol dioxygenase [Acidobacteriota bacterium]